MGQGKLAAKFPNRRSNASIPPAEVVPGAVRLRRRWAWAQHGGANRGENESPALCRGQLAHISHTFSYYRGASLDVTRTQATGA